MASMGLRRIALPSRQVRASFPLFGGLVIVRSVALKPAKRAPIHLLRAIEQLLGSIANC
jgi:hypothetical protein